MTDAAPVWPVQRRIGAWNFTVWRGTTRFVGMAKQGMIVTADPIKEPGSYRFAFGISPVAAFLAIQRDIANYRPKNRLTVT